MNRRSRERASRASPSPPPKRRLTPAPQYVAGALHPIVPKAARRLLNRIREGGRTMADDKEKGKKTQEVEEDENEGEGSKSADRAYRHDVDEFLRENDPSELARNAEADVEREPEKYREAEEEGKRRSAGDLEADKDLI